jgi:trans-aconitate 2-methyltransferase
LTRSTPAEWNASIYHQISNPLVDWGAQVLSSLQLQGDETAIDGGCGTGRLTAQLLERLPEGSVIAVDRSANMLTEAAAYLKPRFGNRVRFIRADLQLLSRDLLGETVDLIFSTATFHWIPDHPRLFTRLYMLLKPGGMLLAQCGGGPNLRSLLQRTAKIMSEEPYPGFFGGWTGPWCFADDLITNRRLEDAGFVDVETSLVSAPVRMAGADEYRTYIANVIFGEHLIRLPEPLRDPFVERHVELARGDSPSWTLDYWRLNMRGRRPS